MTAHDDARTALNTIEEQAVKWKDIDPDVAGPIMDAAARAVSDVWEPIVRDLLPFVRLYARRFGSGETAVLAAEEALGEA